MKKFLGTNIAVVLLLCCASIVNSQTTDIPGWQDAKWGMSEQEIVSAFKPKIIKLDKRQVLLDDFGYADYAIPNYEIEGNKFRCNRHL